MPRKGLFTASTCILLAQPVPLDTVETCLADFSIMGRTQSRNVSVPGEPTLLLPLGDHEHGRVIVDVIDQPWPDHMGDPQTDPALFSAWSMGFFGPFTYPGNLERSVQQAWVWPEAGATVAQHQAFIRIRTTYAVGARNSDPVMPADYDPLEELTAITSVALRMGALPEALCYFNPNGESLCPMATLVSAWARYQDGGPLPLDVWSNRRLFRLQDLAGWVIMDTVGMAQFDTLAYEMREHEACFLSTYYDANEVALFLLNTAHLFVTKRPPIFDGTTTDGPGGLWRAQGHDTSLLAPPRRVWRWVPQDGVAVPTLLQG